MGEIASETLPGPVGSSLVRQKGWTDGSLVTNRYRLLDALGAGGTGMVWLAYDRVLDRHVALKQVGRSCYGRAREEACAAARVQHPHVVRIYDVVADSDELCWIVMEALPGESLASRIKRERRLPIAQTRRIALSLLSALTALAHADVVHRDVKPSNVQLDHAGRVVLTDFGVAVSLRRGPSSVLAGTLGYIAPEAVLDGSYSAASDLYGLGATLFCAIEGRPQFPLSTLEDLVRHARRPPAPPPLMRAGSLEPLITGLLQPRVQDRWTADEANGFFAGIAPREGHIHRE